MTAFWNIIKFLLLIGIIYLLVFDYKWDPKAEKRHVEITEKVEYQTMLVDSLTKLYVAQRVQSVKIEDSLIKQIKSVTELIKTNNQKISDDKKKLQSANDSANVRYFIDYTNQWNSSTNR